MFTSTKTHNKNKKKKKISITHAILRQYKANVYTLYTIAIYFVWLVWAMESFPELVQFSYWQADAQLHTVHMQNL